VPRRRQLERGGVRLACRDFGGVGSPVVLLHGLAGHAGEWDETAHWLSAGHRVLALDARGHGRSERLPADVSRAAHVADVAHVVEQMGLAPVALVGQSLGGHTALLVAAEHPDLVRALVVAEASPAQRGDAAVAELGAALASWPLPFPTRAAAVEFFGGAAWADGLEQRGDGWWPRFDPQTMERTLREAVSRSYWREWERIECPVLVVRAGNGTLPAAEAEAMAERLPRARLLEIPDAGHDLHLDRPTEWRTALGGFLGAC
jgi:pimeloyl-ACP methyl ester carboxylesterase